MTKRPRRSLPKRPPARAESRTGPGIVITHTVSSLRGSRLRLVRRAAGEALRTSKARRAQFGVVLAGDTLLRTLNRRYLGHDRPTDVLAFPAISSPRGGSAVWLGDVVISVVTARRQARAAGHSLEQELALLTVHGALHLLGHDHGTRAEKARMWKMQDRALRAAGVRARPNE
jgi:probable rRNA maturation factor